MTENQVYKLFFDEITLPDIIECPWVSEGQGMVWNTDHDLEDLKNQDGNTYSIEIARFVTSKNGFSLYNVWDNGDTYQIIFNDASEVHNLEDDED